jgi:hypothetical protein
VVPHGISVALVPVYTLQSQIILKDEYVGPGDAREMELFPFDVSTPKLLS